MKTIALDSKISSGINKKNVIAFLLAQNNFNKIKYFDQMNWC